MMWIVYWLIESYVSLIRFVFFFTHLLSYYQPVLNTYTYLAILFHYIDTLKLEYDDQYSEPCENNSPGGISSET